MTDLVARIGIACRRGFGRVTPEPFVLAVVLTFVVFAFALARGGGESAPGPADLAVAWGQGVWNLLGFGMQICVMLVLGSAVAESPIVSRALGRAIDWARSPRQLVASVAAVAILLGLFNWSVGLIGGAVLARRAGELAARRAWRLHYPLLCAAGYSGLMVWHGGLSGSAPLKVTRAADLAGVLGDELARQVGPLGLDQTLFGELNCWVSGGLLVLGPVVFAALTPRNDPDPRGMPDADAAPGTEDDDRGSSPQPKRTSWLDRFEDSPVWCVALALGIGVSVVIGMNRRGWARLDLNTVNLIAWALALALHGRPRKFLAACQSGIASCTGVLIAFPLYAGIMALMNASGTSLWLTSVVSEAGSDALASVTFGSAALVNLFVPSGGGQWAVQGPVIMRAAVETGASPADIVMAMAYGDQLTNMLQPFWALPLLAITGVRARDIVGYAAIWMLAGGAWMLAMLHMWSG